MKTSKKTTGLLTPVLLDDVYAHPGQYNAKIMIDPRESQSLELVNVSIKNADGSQIPMTYRRWGTKLTLSFEIENHVPDGVAFLTAEMVLRGKTIAEHFRLWIVKED